MPSSESFVPAAGDESGVQPERTGLAWNRTLVAMAIAFAIFGVHSFHEGLPISVAVVSAVITAAILIVSSPFSRLRARQGEEFMSGTLGFMPVMPLMLLSAVATALALASGIVILLRG